MKSVLLLVLLPFMALYAQADSLGKAFFKEGNAALKKDQCGQAIAWYDSALSREPHEFYHYQRGLALRKCRREAEARQAFLAAVARNPKFVQAYLGLGNQYYDEKQYEPAMNEYMRALGVKQDFAPAVTGLALSQMHLSVQCVEQKRYSEAIAFAIKSLAYDSLQSLPHLVLAKAYNRLGKHRQAKESALTSVSLLKDVQKGAGYLELGIAERNLGDAESARAAFLKAREFEVFRRAAEAELGQIDTLRNSR